VEQTFSTFDVLKILDIKRERLREWVNRGFIIPTVRAKGLGSKAVFSMVDIYKIAVFKKLVESGVQRRRAAEWVKSNPRISNLEDIKDLNYIFLDDKGGKWISYSEPGPWNLGIEIEQDHDWDTVILVNFKKMKKQIAIALEHL